MLIVVWFVGLLNEFEAVLKKGLLLIKLAVFVSLHISKIYLFFVVILLVVPKKLLLEELVDKFGAALK